MPHDDPLPLRRRESRLAAAQLLRCSVELGPYPEQFAKTTDDARRERARPLKRGRRNEIDGDAEFGLCHRVPRGADEELDVARPRLGMSAEFAQAVCEPLKLRVSPCHQRRSQNGKKLSRRKGAQLAQMVSQRAHAVG